MNVRPSVLCPVDCTDTSLAALRYATAIAEHFVTRLIVLSVQPPDERDGDYEVSRERLEQSLSTFVERAFGIEKIAPMCEFDVAYGTPSAEILRVARERSCDLIVMSAGEYAQRERRIAVADRVLAAATQPVLLIPAATPGAVRLEDIRRQLRQIVRPVGRFSDSLQAVMAMAAV
jgi:nucleotide-binding universal stress UspA family protein